MRYVMLVKVIDVIESSLFMWYLNENIQFFFYIIYNEINKYWS